MGLDNEDPRLVSTTHGPPTFLVAFRDKRIPVLPRPVATEVVAAADGTHPWISQFSLPFGLVALATVEPYVPPGPPADPLPPKTKVSLNGPVFPGAEKFVAATQVRVQASGSGAPLGAADPSRELSGSMQQTPNVTTPVFGVTSVLPPEVVDAVNSEFYNKIPLHHGDLSGYGLSAFSHWRKSLATAQSELTGVTQVRFDVVVGRTAYELIQLASRLWHPQARVTRTIIIERGNSANVFRYDSGWVAIEDGDCQKYAPIDTGVVKRYRNIRNIRILPKPVVSTQGGSWTWQEVLYDADLQLIPDPVGQPEGFTVPIRDHVGFVQLKPPNVLPTPANFVALMSTIGRPTGGPIDVNLRLGGTLAIHATNLEVALAPGADAWLPQFLLAVRGAPLLPRAGQWSAVAIDATTGDVAPVDPRRGLPVIRTHYARAFEFREPATVFTANASSYGLLFSSPAARVLFPAPRVDPLVRNSVGTGPPLIADPAALAVSTGQFPRLPATLACAEFGKFLVDAADKWRLDVNGFTFTANPQTVATGAGWSIDRAFTAGPRRVELAVDSAQLAVPWRLDVKLPDELALRVDGFGEILKLRSGFTAAAGRAAGFAKPTVVFGTALDQLKKIVDALGRFVDLGFKVDVDVSAGSGPTPSFIVALSMRLRLPEAPGTRVDIGMGKFRGEFDLRGRLQAAPNGITSGELGVELSGDLQQAIIPPALFAGGQFRFVARIDDKGKPVIELGFGTAASVGGALIKGLLELEATVRYGYTLVPETLKPGVMLGIEARAKLLAGLIGFSFRADAMARIERLDPDNKTVTIWAEIRVAATVQIAVLIEEEIDFRTQFQQKVPLEAIWLAGGGALPLALASQAV